MATITASEDRQMLPQISNSITPMLGIGSMSSSLLQYAFVDSITPFVFRQKVSGHKTEIAERIIEE
jgi:hypothetical protein